MIFSIEDILPIGSSALIGNLDLLPSFNEIIFKHVFQATGDSKVLFTDYASPMSKSIILERILVLAVCANKL